MYLYGPENTRIWTDSNRNFTLRQYARLEYGSSEVGWIVSQAIRAKRPTSATSTRPGLRMRLRYFLNSFRGFAALDGPGHNDVDRV